MRSNSSQWACTDPKGTPRVDCSYQCHAVSRHLEWHWPVVQMDPAAIREHVNRAAAVIDQMLESIMRDMFVDQATAFVTTEVPD